MRLRAFRVVSSRSDCNGVDLQSAEEEMLENPSWLSNYLPWFISVYLPEEVRAN